MTQIEAATQYLVGARGAGDRRAAGLPEGARPQNAAEAYDIQRAVIAVLGPIGGWKVGSLAPDSDVFTCAPLAKSGIVDSPVPVRGSDRKIEAEIAVRLARDLPAREAPYGQDEIKGAIASAHPAIEVLESRFADPTQVDAASMLADSLGHYSLVVGPAIADWDRVDLAQEEVVVMIDGREVKRRRGNPGGDMMRLLRWLADTGARWDGGLRAGQVVTTGSWTGVDLAPAGTEARIQFAHAGEASVRFVL